MRKILVVALIALIALTGCTANEPAPAPTYYVPPITLPPPTPTPVEPPVSTFPLVCTPPTQAVMAWLREKLQSPDMPESDVIMVDVGTGNVPGSDWWIVAARLFANTATPYGSWLTDTPSTTGISDGQWITLHNYEKWGWVDWSEDRLDRGKAAQVKAISCLEATSA